MKTAVRARFELCIENDGCDDLEVGKVYRTLGDRAASAVRYMRVVDESGEDYLYPMAYFVPIDLPSKAKRALTARPRPRTIRRSKVRSR
ncbi:MAG TPA: hypothetical protein VFW70_16745 [Methylomirabilota bacterium]|nr:hypothetical protein [Methylomirabilota bacterium]